MLQVTYKKVISQQLCKHVSRTRLLQNTFSVAEAIILYIDFNRYINVGIRNVACECVFWLLLLPPPLKEVMIIVIILFISLVKSIIKSSTINTALPVTVPQGTHTHRAYKCKAGLCPHTCSPSWIHSDKAGETETAVKGDNISFSRGVTSFSVGRCGGFWTVSLLAIWLCRSPLWANTRRVSHWHVLMVWSNIGGSCKLGISLLHIPPLHSTAPPTCLCFPFTCSRR